MELRIVTEYSESLREGINALIPQLSRSTPPLSEETVRALLEQKAVYLIGAFDEEGHLHGMLTLATFVIPTGVRAWIEDVVVDASTRGTGVGRALVDYAVDYAQQIGAKSIDLTSRPSREAANRLYQRSGFTLRETNVYRFAGGEK